MTIAEILKYLQQPSGHQSDPDGLEMVLHPGLPDPPAMLTSHGITGLVVGPYLQCYFCLKVYGSAVAPSDALA